MPLPKLKKIRIGNIWGELSSGNIWYDLGFRDAEERKAKADLAWTIRKRIEKLGLTQTAAGKRMSIPQPKVNDIVNLRTQSYTIDRLARMLTRLGATVEVNVSFGRKRAGLRVRS